MAQFGVYGLGPNPEIPLTDGVQLSGVVTSGTGTHAYYGINLLNVGSVYGISVILQWGAGNENTIVINEEITTTQHYLYLNPDNTINLVAPSWHTIATGATYLVTVTEGGLPSDHIMEDGFGNVITDGSGNLMTEE